MIVTIVKIIVNQQSFIFYIAGRSHCATDTSRVKAGVFLSGTRTFSLKMKRYTETCRRNMVLIRNK